MEIVVVANQISGAFPEFLGSVTRFGVNVHLKVVTHKNTEWQ